MANLVLFLSGKWHRNFEEGLSDEDLFFCSPGNKPVDSKFPWVEFSRKVEVADARVLEEYLSIFSDTFASEAFEAIVNEYYEYALSPVICQLSTITEVLRKNRFSKVLVYSTKSKLRELPYVGYKTKESNLGSPHIIGGVVANIIREADLGSAVEFRTLRGDLFCVNQIRKTLIYGFALVLVLKTLVRLFRMKPNQDISKKQSGIAVIARSTSQLQHALRLFAGRKGVTIFVLPQFSGANILNQLTHRSGADFFSVPTASEAFSALKESLFTHSAHATGSFQERASLAIGPFSIEVSRRNLRSEFALLPFLKFYRELLCSHWRRNGQLSKIVSFEIKGRMIGLERQVADSLQTPIIGVQTTLVPQHNIPVFPQSSTFYVDSIHALQNVRSVGFTSRGKLKFAGSPYSLTQVRPLLKIKRVIFLTQPYEYDTTAEILIELGKLSQKYAFELTIKLHPRDVISNYSLPEFLDEIISVSNIGSIEKCAEYADLCVTRTSSAIKEIVSAGGSVIACTWSQYDRSIQSEYLCRDELKAHYISEDAAELSALMASPGLVSQAAQSLQARLYSGPDYRALTDEIVK